jgi:hypothetical protein
MHQSSLFSENQTGLVPRTMSVVKQLKDAGQDHEWYPSTHAQIEIVANDICALREHFSFSDRYSDSIIVLDVGSGDGRALAGIKKILESCEHHEMKVSTLGVEKSAIHTQSYREKGITLIGTEFDEINFISKNCDIAFCNPIYSAYNTWMATLISQLNFRLMYAIIPERWESDAMIKDAIKRRGVKRVDILAESDFYDAERKARCKVHIVRFAFHDLDVEKLKNDRHYTDTIGQSKESPFQLFIENELNLKKNYSETTQAFHAFKEKERVRKDMATDGTQCFDIAVSRGVLWALLDNYERDLASVLEQYKAISKMDPLLLQELGVKYDLIRDSIKEKLYGFRNVYWELLFEQLQAISSKLIGIHKTEMLNTLKANSLDFTYKNALYIIEYACQLANEKIEQSLIDVFKDLTAPESISTYYKSNEHILNDDWRYNCHEKDIKSRYLLDYRFIYSSWSNFHTESYKHGLNDSARTFANDLMVIFGLLGYGNIECDTQFDDVEMGGKLILSGTCQNGKSVKLVEIRFYKKGSRHLRFNQAAMLRFNVTVSRLLGWVREKEDFVNETDGKVIMDDKAWNVRDTLKLIPDSILALTVKKAA